MSARPYLAFELDALDNAAMAATALGIKPGDVAWGLLQLWRWCWRQKREVVSDTAVQLAFGPDPRVGLVLAEAGFLAAEDDGTWRVRGAGRYLRVSEQRSAAGKARAAGKRNARGQLLPLDDEDTNSTEKPADGQRSTSGQPALSASSDERAVREEVAVAAPRHPSKQQRFAAWFSRQRAEALPGVVADHDVGAARLNKELGWVKSEDPHLVAEAAALFLADPYRRSQDPPCSLLWFSKDRATYLSKASKQDGAAA